MSQQFEKLLEPGKIGPVTTRNHIIKTANGTSFMDFDIQGPGDSMIAYYERLAKGGVGYLTVESCGVEYPQGIQHVHYEGEKLLGGVQLHIDDDRHIPQFKRLSDAIHKHGCPCSVQLQHAGAWNPTGLLPKRDTKAPSTMTKDMLPGPDFVECRGMTRDEVEEMIEIWVAAALRVYKAGFDGVEINHGTVHQGAMFLSRVWNRREDEFGPQSFENRTRYLRECVMRTKKRAGGNFAVTVLMNGIEFRNPKGTTLEEGAQMIKLVAEVADGVNIRAHSYGHRGGLIQPDKICYPETPNDLPELDWSHFGWGATVPLVANAKKLVKNTPIWTACRLDHVSGEKYLREGKIDFVGMTRRLLADPELPNKVKEGRLEDIRTCHGCLHCFDVRNKNQRLECRVNATLGREINPDYQAAAVPKKKKVLVVGGGPAGMEAAIQAAQRGHEVVLYEKASYLGGCLPVAAIVKDLETEDIMEFVAYQQTQLKKLGVKVHLNKDVDLALVKKEKADAVICAVGAAHTTFNIPGGDSKKLVPSEKLHNRLKSLLKIFSPAQLQKLTNYYMPVGKKAAVVGGELHGCELAEFITKRGRAATMIHNGPELNLGKGMIVDDLMNLWPWFKKKGVDVYTDVKYNRISDKGFEFTTKEGKTVTLEVDNIMYTQDMVPDTKLSDQLKGVVPEVYNIGSSREPAFIVEAVREGAQIGLKI
jgi:2,4-dienoyl-CoA reductase (NADPH2)